MGRRNIAILGSTGSIGRNTIDVVAHLGEPFQVVAISGHRNQSLLFDQAEQIRPNAIGITLDSDSSRNEHDEFAGAKVYRGSAGLCDMVRRDDVDIVVAAIVGFAGLEPVLAAVEAGKTIALANKESLVVAGSILMPLARKCGATIIPVDSEHSAVFQAMHAGRLKEVRRVLLTASGGPFRDWPIERMQNATAAEALNHPTWQMGKKITIDSATMMNKGLEIIEACWLFDLPPEKIEVVVHPESIVHSMVEFVDGSTLAQLSPPDMKTPIQYALTWPDRAAGCGRKMNWSSSVTLNFQPPDMARFPALQLAYDVASRRGTLGAVLNAANEVAVAAFLAGMSSLGMICETVERTIESHRLTAEPSLVDLKEADRWARQTAQLMME